jgi:hypothetical protein
VIRKPMKILVLDGGCYASVVFESMCGLGGERRGSDAAEPKWRVFKQNSCCPLLSAKQKLILVSVLIAMDELCCPRWLWRGRRSRSQIEKLLANPSPQNMELTLGRES